MKKTALFLASSVCFIAPSLLGQSDSKVDFGKQIWPILEKNCVECHGPKKQKGKLRLDSREEAIKDAIVPGKSEESELIARITLPADHDDIMPPKDGPLPADQINLLKLWISQGAEWTAPVSNPAPAAGAGVDPQALKAILEKLSPEEAAVLRKALGKDTSDAAPQETAPEVDPHAIHLVEAPVTAEETNALKQLQDAGVLAMKVAQNVNWLRANFRLQGKSITDAALAPLPSMKNLIEVDLGNTAITDAGLASIKDLPNLTRINLDNTAITDAGLVHLKDLKNLEILNLYGSKVTDAGMPHLTGIKTLKKIYLWQTEVTDAGVETLQKANPKLQVIRGWDLSKVVEKTEEVKAAEPAKEEPKKEEPKAEAKPAAAAASSGPNIATLLVGLANQSGGAAAAPAAADDCPVNAPNIANLLLGLAAPGGSAATSPAPTANKPGNTIADLLLNLQSAPAKVE